MQVIQLLPPNPFGEDAYRVLGGLPEPALAVLSRLAAKDFREGPRQMNRSMLQKLAAGELAQVVQGVFEPLQVEVHVEHHRVQMGRHDDVGVDPQGFVLGAEIEAVGNDLAGGVVDEDWQPLNDGEGAIIQADALDDAISLHAAIIRVG